MPTYPHVSDALEDAVNDPRVMLYYGSKYRMYGIRKLDGTVSPEDEICRDGPATWVSIYAIYFALGPARRSSAI